MKSRIRRCLQLLNLLALVTESTQMAQLSRESLVDLPRVLRWLVVSAIASLLAITPLSYFPLEAEFGEAFNAVF